MDRYKIVKRLEYCAENKCDICQEENGSGFPWIDGQCYGFTERLYDALALLKAQEPVEPYTKRDGRTTFFLCGGCNKPLCIAKDSYKPKHCPECGREVKWA